MIPLENRRQLAQWIEKPRKFFRHKMSETGQFMPELTILIPYKNGHFMPEKIGHFMPELTGFILERRLAYRKNEADIR